MSFFFFFSQSNMKILTHFVSSSLGVYIHTRKHLLKKLYTSIQGEKCRIQSCHTNFYIVIVYNTRFDTSSLQRRNTTDFFVRKAWTRSSAKFSIFLSFYKSDRNVFGEGFFATFKVVLFDSKSFLILLENGCFKC